MAITSALVLLAVVWFMVLFVVLPLRLRTQGDEGDIVPGTHASAPANFSVGRTARTVTIAALLIWAVLVAIIVSGVITVDGIDAFSQWVLRVVGGTNG